MIDGIVSRRECAGRQVKSSRERLRRPARRPWYGFQRLLRVSEVSTHARAFRSPWTAASAHGFVADLLASPGFAVLVATRRHAAVLAQTLSELPDLHGNAMHDVHTAVLMREHGISRICTRDADFRRFPFLTVVDPSGASRDRR